MTPERRAQIILLIASRNDARYEPPLSRAEQGAARGEVGTLKRACPVCKGERWTHDKYKRPTPCTYCGGQLEHMDGDKRVNAKEGRGWVAIDEYTQAEPRPSAEPDRGITVRTVHCDRCDRGVRAERPCQHCAGTGQVRLLGDRLRATHTARERPEDTLGDCRLIGEQRWRLLGSYEALDDALAGLGEVMPIARTLVRRVYETGELRERDLGPVLRPRLEFGLRFLDVRLPDRIRVPAAIREAAVRQRVRAGLAAERVRRLRAEGVSLPGIQRACLLSRAQVLDVLGRAV